MTNKTETMVEQFKAKSNNININLLPLKVLFLVLWGMGLIVSKGFWWTFFCVFPPIGAGTSVLWLIERFTGA